MGRIVRYGAAVGAPVGVVVALLVSRLVFGTDDIDGFVDREALPVLYVFAALTGAFVGACLGLVLLAFAVMVSRQMSGGAQRRRPRAAVAAGALSAGISLLSLGGIAFGAGILISIALGAVSGGLVWWLLPKVVDLDAPAPGTAPGAPPVLPARYGETPAAPLTVVTPTPKRVLITVVGAGVGSFFGTQVVMTLATTGSLGRQTADVIAFAVLAALFVALAALIWPRTASIG